MQTILSYVIVFLLKHGVCISNIKLETIQVYVWESKLDLNGFFVVDTKFLLDSILYQFVCDPSLNHT